MYKKTVNEILNQEISRKDFLKAGGAVALTVIGIPSLVNTIVKAFSTPEKNSKQLSNSSQGYGARPYGR